MRAFRSLWSPCAVVGILIGQKLPMASSSGTSFCINGVGTDLFLIILLQEVPSGSVSGKNPVSPRTSGEPDGADGELWQHPPALGSVRSRLREDRRMWLWMWPPFFKQDTFCILSLL